MACQACEQLVSKYIERAASSEPAARALPRSTTPILARNSAAPALQRVAVIAAGDSLEAQRLWFQTENRRDRIRARYG
jgi:hypothetical protein